MNCIIYKIGILFCVFSLLVTNKVNANNPTNRHISYSYSINDTVVDIDVYPNPASEILYFNNPGCIQQYCIYDITGERVKFSSAVESEKVDIDIMDLKKGIYFITFFLSDNKTITKKVIVKK